ncbi:MAG: hypothetical protein ACLR2E_07890 [Lachnospiraceae bacterium]
MGPGIILWVSILTETARLRRRWRTALSSLLAEKDWGSLVYIEGAASSRENFYSLYGGIFFVGIFLGFLFLMATVLIIYYKQVSEGYEDHDRFVIMQKVGMDKREVRRTINSQVKTVFLLPVLAAGVHMVFAYPMMSKILLLMNLGNQKIFLIGVASDLFYLPGFLRPGLLFHSPDLLPPRTLVNKKTVALWKTPDIL